MFKFPDSVSRYLSEADVLTAAELLIDSDPSDLHADGWDRLKSYYRAYAGAQALRSAWAEALVDLWTEIWGECLGTGWRALSPHEQAKEADWHVDLETLWDDSEYVRVFSKNGDFLVQGVRLDLDDGVQVGFGLVDSKWRTKVPGVFGYDIGETHLRWSQDGLVPLDSTIDLEPLKRIATELWSACDASGAL